MSDNDTATVELDLSDTPIGDEGSGSPSMSRRNVLKGAGALAGSGTVLSAFPGTVAADHNGQLNVRTTDVEVLDQPQSQDSNHGTVRTKGRVSGMLNYDCERCEVGAHVKPVGGHKWYGGLQTVEHTPRDSFRVGVTLTGLTPGRYKCRFCACPITKSNIFVANILIVVINPARRKKDHDHKKKHKKKKKHHKKLKKAYHSTCPCNRHHPNKYHLMVCGGGGRNVLEYAFQVSTRNITRVNVSAAPNVIADRHITIDTEDYINGNIVTGAVAGGGDAYVCGGYLENMRLDDGARAFINGVEVTDAVGGGY